MKYTQEMKEKNNIFCVIVVKLVEKTYAIKKYIDIIRHNPS